MDLINTWWQVVQSLLSTYGSDIMQALIFVTVGILLARVLGATSTRLLKDRLSQHQVMLYQRALSYLILTLFGVSALNQLGFDLGILLGAAGLLTVAVGFAAQTSTSNLISGLFLVLEQPFAVGDLIKVDSQTGIVLSIDLLSTKLRTFENTYVRIPNETIIKSPMVNLTKFPIRRIDLTIRVAFREDLEQIRQLLFQAADEHPLCLENPAPIFIFLGYDEAAIRLQFSVWAQRNDYLTILNDISLAIRRIFDQAGVEQPYPHRVIETMADPPLQNITSIPDSETPDQP